MKRKVGVSANSKQWRLKEAPQSRASNGDALARKSLTETHCRFVQFQSVTCS